MRESERATHREREREREVEEERERGSEGKRDGERERGIEKSRSKGINALMEMIKVATNERSSHCNYYLYSSSCVVGNLTVRTEEKGTKTIRKLYLKRGLMK